MVAAYDEAPPLFGPLDLALPLGTCWVQGANGSGKSTLLKLLAGAMPPAAGRLRLHLAASAGAGASQPAPVLDLREDPLAWRREVFWCAPEGPAAAHLSPVQWLGFMASLYPRFDLDAAGAHALALGLRPHAHQPIDTLSSGTRRKVALAGALASGCSLMLLDEPLNALDEAAAIWLRRVLAIRALARAEWLLVCSHTSFWDCGVAAEVSAAVARLSLPEGRMQAADA